MARAARTYTVTRTAEGRILTADSDGSYVLDWAPTAALDSADDRLAAA